MKRDQNLTFDFFSVPPEVPAAPTPAVPSDDSPNAERPVPARGRQAGARRPAAPANVTTTQVSVTQVSVTQVEVTPLPTTVVATAVVVETAPAMPEARGSEAAPEAAPQAAPEPPRALTVAELGRTLRHALEDVFEAPVWVEGEVVGARPAASGHLYFTLKDEKEDASIDVVMYRSSVTPKGRSLVRDGARVRLRGRPVFWAPRGRLQFIGDRVEALGRGALLEALERLKAKLAAEGLFAPERKRPLPPEPRRIGVVTSRTGAVIHDICKVAFRRGGARVLLAPALVQGAGAAASMRTALQALCRVHDVDVIILARGGGSTDELSVFNDESLVRAVAACHVPIVSAVGHEVDVTLVDFAADARAATPSQAAEMIVADGRARRAELRQLKARLSRAMTASLAESRVELARLEKKLGDPRLALASYEGELDDLSVRLASAERRVRERYRGEIARLEQRLAHVHPRAVITRERASVSASHERLVAAIRMRLQRHAAQLGSASARLHAMSPLKVLSRGYSIATRADGRAIRQGRDVAPGDALRVRVQDANIEAQVVGVEEIDS